MSVSIDDIGDYFNKLQAAIAGIPAGLIYNLDESWFQRFSDAKNETVVVPKDSTGRFYPVSRSQKRTTFLAAVSADGQKLKPLLIIARKTLDAELMLAGYTPSQAAFETTESGYINTLIFEKYVELILIRNIEEKRGGRPRMSETHRQTGRICLERKIVTRRRT